MTLVVATSVAPFGRTGPSLNSRYIFSITQACGSLSAIVLPKLPAAGDIERTWPPLHGMPAMRHAPDMPIAKLHESESASPPNSRFGAGLTETEVRRFQSILRQECGVDLALPEAWSRAIELLSLVEMLLRGRGVLDCTDDDSTEFALPRS